MTTRQILGIAGGVVALLLAIILPVSFLTDVDAGEIVVYQAPGGEMTVWTTPGWRLTGFGSTTRYTKSAEFQFHGDKATEGDEAGKIVFGAGTKDCIDARFNDQGKAAICGQLSFDLPIDEASFLKLHEKYRSMEGIRARLVRPAVIKSIYNSGPLMSSRESAGQRRSDLIEYIRDQATRGVYKTETKTEEVDDLGQPPIETVEMVDVPKLDENGEPVLDEDQNPIMTKKGVTTLKPRKKQVQIVEPIRDEKGAILVQEKSITTEMGISLYNITIGNIVYEPKVQAQIDKQRDMEMNIQTKISEAEQAKQDAITAEQSGKAEAAKAKWAQEKEKATVVTKAEQAREKAALDLEAAKLERQAQVERAKGEAEAKKLVMDADGALDKKLKAWQAVNAEYAKAFAAHPLVPYTVVGGDGKSSAGATVDGLMGLMMAQTARQIQLDTDVKK